MENQMETTIMGYIGIILGFYRGYIRIMEKKMETTGSIRFILVGCSYSLGSRVWSHLDPISR